MYKLLIVDDEYEIRNGLSKYFPWSEIGFDVIGEAEDGLQALTYIQKNPVDVVLCDIKMPVMTGLELSEELYKQKSKVRVILLSGFRDFEFAQKALSCGVKNYIVKSTKYDELFSIFIKIKNELDMEHASQTVLIKENRSLAADNGCSFNEKIILTIKNYTKDHYKDVTLEDIAQLVHMHPHYLGKFFKRETGQYFSDFLISVKMQKASELLLSYVNYKTYDVSEIIGYSNPKNFTRAFKGYFGKSPRSYRNSMQDRGEGKE